MRRPTNTVQSVEEAAHAYHLAQAAKLISLFEKEHGDGPKTVEELSTWVGSPEGKAALAPHHDANGHIIP